MNAGVKSQYRFEFIIIQAYTHEKRAAHSDTRLELLQNTQVIKHFINHQLLMTHCLLSLFIISPQLIYGQNTGTQTQFVLRVLT